MSSEAVADSRASNSETNKDRVFRIPEQVFELNVPLCTRSAANCKLEVKVFDQFGEEFHPFTFQVSLTDLQECAYLTISGTSDDSKLKYERSFCRVDIKDTKGEELVSFKGYMDEPSYNSFWFFNICNVTHLEQKLKNVVINVENVEGLSLSVCVASCDEVWSKSIRGQKVLLDEGVLTDLVIKTKEHDFPCHKMVLAAESEYFRTMFTVSMKENETNELDWTNIFDDSTVAGLLHFIYTGSKPIDIEEIAHGLLEAAHLCLLPELKSMCVHTMFSRNTVDNVTKTLETALQFRDNDLVEQSVKFMVLHCEEVKRSFYYKNLDLETKSALFDMFFSVVNKNFDPKNK